MERLAGEDSGHVQSGQMKCLDGLIHYMATTVTVDFFPSFLRAFDLLIVVRILADFLQI